MTPIPAKVLSIDKQSSQYRVLVQIELEKYIGSFHTEVHLRIGAEIIYPDWPSRNGLRYLVGLDEALGGAVFRFHKDDVLRIAPRGVDR
jgi:hypothetical protein